MKTTKILITGIVIIILAAFLDNIIIGDFTFKWYLVICLIEVGIFMIGFYCGQIYNL